MSKWDSGFFFVGIWIIWEYLVWNIFLDGDAHGEGSHFLVILNFFFIRHLLLTALEEEEEEEGEKKDVFFPIPLVGGSQASSINV